MGKAHVDPTELRSFARDLSRFSEEMRTLMNRLNGRLRSLEQTWRDQEQRKFAEDYSRTMKTVARFLEATDEHVEFLQKRAGHIEAYLRQR